MKVLLATDGSEHAEEAARFLAHFPHRETLELTVLSVSYVNEIHGSLEVVEWMKQSAESEKKKSTEVCQNVASMFDGANAKIEIVVPEGHVGKSIVHEAEARGVDLVVIGSVGHTTLDRLLLGSVSDFVATHAPCSVLVVRPTGLGDVEHKPLSVSIGYDESAPSEFALEQLERFGWGENSEINVVNVLALPFSYAEVPVEIDTEAIKIAATESLKNVATRLHAIARTVNGHVVEANHIGDALVRFATDKNSDILMVGDTGRGMLGRFLLGSVSRYVVRHAHCSVWIARNGIA